MAYQEELADRIRELLDTGLPVEEKEMFQGLCFMVNDKMCICTRENHLLCRIGEEQVELEIEKEYVTQMMSNGRKMKDYVFVDADNARTKKDLTYWVNLCLAFNPTAKSSKAKASTVKSSKAKAPTSKSSTAKSPKAQSPNTKSWKTKASTAKSPVAKSPKKASSKTKKK